VLKLVFEDRGITNLLDHLFADKMTASVSVLTLSWSLAEIKGTQDIDGTVCYWEGLVPSA